MNLFLTTLLTQPFLQHALFGGLVASSVCGLIGPFVVVRKIGYIAGAIAHTALGGMGVAAYFSVEPLYGALVAALTSAVIISIVSKYSPEHEDSLINALWSFGMAIGLIFISKTPGYGDDLVSYLFGNMLMIGESDLTWMVGLGLIVGGTVVYFYRQFLAISFDESFARTRGLAVDGLTLLLHLLIALTIVLLIRVVGLIMVIALLTLPVVTAETFCLSLGKIMIAAIGLGCLATSFALYFAFIWDLPVGATTVIVLVCGYLLSIGLKKLRSNKKNVVS